MVALDNKRKLQLSGHSCLKFNASPRALLRPEASCFTRIIRKTFISDA